MNDVKRLYRSNSDRMIGGVCSGLAEYFSMDPSLVRLIFLILFLMGTMGFWPYLILWILVPEKP